AFVIRMIKICTFICKLCIVRKYDKPMCKVFRNKKLLLIFRRKKDTIPLSICFGTWTKIHSNIEHFSADNSYQFILWIINLKMKAAQYALSGRRLIVLDKFHINSCFFIIIVIISFHKISALIAEHCRCDNLQT